MKIVLGCLSAVAVAVVLLGVGVWFWLFRERPMLEAALALPPQAELEAGVTMWVTVTNTHDHAVTLDSIDIDDDFLEGFQVTAIEPRAKDTLHIIGQRSWSFGRVVQPREGLAVRFDLRAVKKGRFTGDVDVCNPHQNFVTLLADVVVRKGGE